ncbi:MAG: hypothetical protein ACFFBP_17405 [Promethearchaeota archaeon]
MKIKIHLPPQIDEEYDNFITKQEKISDIPRKANFEFLRYLIKNNGAFITISFKKERNNKEKTKKTRLSSSHINSNLILPFHPLPKNEKTIGQWIDTLANANLIQFKTLYFYILKLSERYGFLKTLHYLTGVSIELILKLYNDFNPNFKKNEYYCPICDYESKSRYQIFNHLNLIHNLGNQKIQCPYCDYLAKTRTRLYQHYKKKHSLIFHLKIK